jgi:hypothetical protein
MQNERNTCKMRERQLAILVTIEAHSHELKFSHKEYLVIAHSLQWYNILEQCWVLLPSQESMAVNRENTHSLTSKFSGPFW